MERKTSLFSFFAFANASSPHGYQSTGLCACWSRYGLVSRARRLSLTGFSTRERQIADRRGRSGVAGAHAHPSAWRVLAFDERQRDGTLQCERARRARHLPDDGAVGEDLGAVRRYGVSLEQQTAKMTVDVTAIADADNHFLPRIAAFRVRDEALERDLRQKNRRVDVLSPPRS